ncbi:MAG TPA: hypothetical protein VEA80_17170 [Vitreimonas sp.]|uniref:hypothetical protein n=1 Tax=Vitreimonas sp. TaxID=3069702 RepID=UPI002D3F3F44|nr:hypothetical protein [Vitreimonas sp.]HYD89213.1 hypothetical protein [Vitreimonas sp.]
MARLHSTASTIFAALLSTTAFSLSGAALAQANQAPVVREYQTEPPARPRPRTRPLREGVTNVGREQDVIRYPRFIVEAMSFKAVDESGRDIPGTSDEVFATFVTSDRRLMTRNFEDVNTGDLREFDAHQSCIWPAVDPDGEENGRWVCAPQGARGPVRFSVTLWDDDTELPPHGFTICGSNADGTGGDLARCPDEGESGENDILFRHEFAYEVSDILQRLDPNCRCLVQTARESRDSLTTYEFTFRITRVDDGGEGPALDADPDGANQPVHRSGALTAALNQAFEFDVGSIVATGGDFAFARTGGVYQLAPRGNAKIWLGGSAARGYAACYAQRLSANYVATAVAVPAAGQHACYLTSDGRVGEMRITSLMPGSFGSGGTLALTYATWQ